MTRAWEDVRAWLQTNTPTGRGMCLNTSMRAYGADPMGVADATDAVDATHDLQTDYTTAIPAGAHVLYTGGSQGHGHSVVADGDGYVWTVDWYSGLNITRVAQRDMESAWGNLDWAGWSRFYGTQPLDVLDDEPDPPTPPEDDPMPDFANAGGDDVTVADDPASILWADSWGHDYRTGDRKGLTGFDVGTLEVHVNFTPSDAATLCLRQATFDDGEWWHGKWYEFDRTSSGTGAGVTFAASVPAGAAWKVQAKANGAGTVALTDISLRGLVWP